MIASSGPSKRSAASFRTKLLAAMMLVVSAITASGFYLAQRNVTAAAKRDLQQNFQAELSSLDKVQKFRHAAIAERCSALASDRKSTRLNSSHRCISYAVFCLKKK